VSQASFSIGGRQYTVACAEGEEGHVARLGAAVDAKIAELGDNRAPQEAQNLLFAALLIAEDLHQLKNSATADAGEADRLREELDEMRQAAAKQVEAIRADLDKLRSELDDAEQVEAELRSGLSGLVEERDALQEETEELRAALAEGNTQAEGAPQSEQAVDPDLAPALERFAELLENCADKLEGKATDT